MKLWHRERLLKNIRKHAKTGNMAAENLYHQWHTFNSANQISVRYSFGYHFNNNYRQNDLVVKFK